MAPTVIAASATLNAQKCDVAPVDVDEVDDVAGDRAVDQVAERAAEDERQPEPRQPLVEAELRRVGGDRDERDGGDADHHERLVREVDGVQQPERRAGVVHVRQVEESGDHAAALAERQRLADDRLRQLIEGDDRGHRPELERVRVRPRRRRAGGAAPAARGNGDPARRLSGSCRRPRARRRTGRTALRFRLREIASTMRQHRGHFSPSARSTMTSSPAPRPRVRRSARPATR